MGSNPRWRERARYLAKVAAGLCAKCGKRPPSPGKRTCQVCRDDRRALKDVARRAAADRVHYPRGAVCSITHAAWLRGPVEWAWSQPR